MLHFRLTRWHSVFMAAAMIYALSVSVKGYSSAPHTTPQSDAVADTHTDSSAQSIARLTVPSSPRPRPRSPAADSQSVARSATAGQEVQCTLEGSESVVCNGTQYEASCEHILEFGTSAWWTAVALVVVCICISGMMSGLVIGLFTVDVLTLDILATSGTEDQRRYAPRVKELVLNHHWLLVTLMLINTLVGEALPIFLDGLAGPAAAIFIAVALILIFGELVPQSLCARYGLAVGAKLYWFVTFLKYATSPVSYPLALLLDCMVGHKDALFFQRTELKELVALHSEGRHARTHRQRMALSDHEISVIHGALDLHRKTVRELMTPMHRVFKLEEETVLDEATIRMASTFITAASHTDQRVLD